MPRQSMLADMTAPYSALEAWAYDRFIAPAVAQMRERVEATFMALLPTAGSVLDVGCGGGHAAVALAEKRRDLQVTGLDLNPGQVGRARKRAARAGVDARFVQGSALELPFDDATFDGVYSVASIKHWPDPALGVREMARALRPGGRLVVVEADRGCTHEDAAAFVAAWPIPSPLRPLALPFFRTWVAGRSLDLAEAREAAEGAALASVEVSRLEGLPAWLLVGEK